MISTGLALTYECKDERGAILLCARIARANIFANKHLRAYIATHADSWYHFADENGYGTQELPGGRLVLISGCDKTPSYALASFCNNSKEGSLSFQGGFVQSNGPAVNLQGAWGHTDSAECRFGGPRPGADFPTGPIDSLHKRAFPFFSDDCCYTVFARTFEIKQSTSEKMAGCLALFGCSRNQGVLEVPGPDPQKNESTDDQDIPSGACEDDKSSQTDPHSSQTQGGAPQAIEDEFPEPSALFKDPLQNTLFDPDTLKSTERQLVDLGYNLQFILSTFTDFIGIIEAFKSLSMLERLHLWTMSRQSPNLKVLQQVHIESSPSFALSH